MRKAAVFPDPVIELTITSFPEIIAGMLIACTGVAYVNYNSETTFKIGLMSLRSSNFDLSPCFAFF